MLYFKEIDIPYYDIIVQKSLNFVKQNKAVYNRELSTISLYWLNLEDYLTAVPEVNLAFEQYMLKCTAVGIYVMYDPTHTNIHVDYAGYKSKINIPLLNCNNTFTNFYSNCQIKFWFNSQTRDYRRLATNPSEAKLEATIEMKKATVIRATEPHKVELPENNPVPRIVLSLVFNPDPIFMLDSD